MTYPPDIAYAGVFFGKVEESFLQVFGHFLEQTGINQFAVFFHSRLDRRKGECMKSVCVTVAEEFIFEEVCYIFVRSGNAQRCVGGCAPFCSGHYVRKNIPVLHGKWCSGPVPARHDFVRDEEHMVFITDFP